MGFQIRQQLFLESCRVCGQGCGRGRIDNGNLAALDSASNLSIGTKNLARRRALKVEYVKRRTSKLVFLYLRN